MLAVLQKKSASFVDSFYKCNADLFVKTGTLLSDNDLVICDAMTSPAFKLFSCPKRARESLGTPIPFTFLTALLGMTHMIIIN